MNSYSERLIEAMAVKGIDQTELAVGIGVTPQAIQYLCSKGKGSTHTGKIATFCGVSPEWLSDGVGQKILSGGGQLIAIRQNGISDFAKKYNAPLSEKQLLKVRGHNLEALVDLCFDGHKYLLDGQLDQCIDQQSVSADDARLIEEHVDYGSGWLDVDHDNILKAPYISTILKPVYLWESPEDIPSDGYIWINRLDVTAAAGSGHVNSEWPTTEDALPFRSDWVRRSKAQSTNLVIIEITGDSMLPTLASGDDALVDLSQTDINNGQVYVVVLNGEVKVKRLYKTINSIQLASDNSTDARYKVPEEIPSEMIEQLTVIGRIVNRSGSGGL